MAKQLAQANVKAGNAATFDVLQPRYALNLSGLRHAEAAVRDKQPRADLLAALGPPSREAGGLLPVEME